MLLFLRPALQAVNGMGSELHLPEKQEAQAVLAKSVLLCVSGPQADPLAGPA